jgi:hypothetical protein
MYSQPKTAAVLGVIFILGAAYSPSACATPPNDPCSLLTQSQVSTVLGVQVGEGRRVAPKLCEWAIPGESPSLSQKKVTVTLVSEQGFAAAKMPVGSGITKVPATGIGDDAVFGTTPKFATTLTIKKGDFYFVVHVFGFSLDQPKAIDEVQAKEKTLALLILPKL